MSLLPPTARAWAVVGLAVAVAAAVFVVYLGTGGHVAGGSQTIAGHAIPRLLIVFTYLALALLGGLVTVAHRHEGWRVPVVARVVVALVGASVTAGCADASGLIGAFGGRGDLVKALGWTGFALAVLLLVLPRQVLGHASAALLGTSPFLLALAAYAFAGGGATAHDFAASPLVLTATDLGIAVGLLLVWAVVESVRLGRDYGLALAPVVRVAPWLLPAVLSAKLAWIGVGYAGDLPHWFGGASGNWHDSAHNGAVAWVTAAVLVLGGTAWLLARRSAPAETDRLDGVLALVVAGLAAALLAAALLTLLVEITHPWPWATVARHLKAAVDHLLAPKVPPWTVVGTVVAAALVGLARRRTAAGAFLVVFALWSLPRAVTTAYALIENENAPFHAPSLVTLDTVVTLALVVLYALRAVRPQALLVALVVFTLIGHPGVLLPAGWRTGTLFYLALVYPVAWQFLVRARELNGHAPVRPARVLGAIALAALLLVIAAVDVGAGVAGPGVSVLSEFLDDVGRTFLMVPFAALLVAELSRPRSA